jgi:hypothetical protein
VQTSQAISQLNNVSGASDQHATGRVSLGKIPGNELRKEEWDPHSPFGLIKASGQVTDSHNDAFNPVLTGYITGIVRGVYEDKLSNYRMRNRYK